MSTQTQKRISTSTATSLQQTVAVLQNVIECSIAGICRHRRFFPDSFFLRKRIGNANGSGTQTMTQTQDTNTNTRASISLAATTTAVADPAEVVMFSPSLRINGGGDGDGDGDDGGVSASENDYRHSQSQSYHGSESQNEGESRSKWRISPWQSQLSSKSQLETQTQTQTQNQSCNTILMDDQDTDTDIDMDMDTDTDMDDMDAETDTDIDMDTETDDVSNFGGKMNNMNVLQAEARLLMYWIQEGIFELLETAAAAVSTSTCSSRSSAGTDRTDNSRDMHHRHVQSNKRRKRRTISNGNLAGVEEDTKDNDDDDLMVRVVFGICKRGNENRGPNRNMDNGNDSNMGMGRKKRRRNNDDELVESYEFDVSQRALRNAKVRGDGASSTAGGGRGGKRRGGVINRCQIHHQYTTLFRNLQSFSHHTNEIVMAMEEKDDGDWDGEDDNDERSNACTSTNTGTSTSTCPPILDSSSRYFTLRIEFNEGRILRQSKSLPIALDPSSPWNQNAATSSTVTTSSEPPLPQNSRNGGIVRREDGETGICSGTRRREERCATAVGYRKNQYENRHDCEKEVVSSSSSPSSSLVPTTLGQIVDANCTGVGMKVTAFHRNDDTLDNFCDDRLLDTEGIEIAKDRDAGKGANKVDEHGTGRYGNGNSDGGENDLFRRYSTYTDNQCLSDANMSTLANDCRMNIIRSQTSWNSSAVTSASECTNSSKESSMPSVKFNPLENGSKGFAVPIVPDGVLLTKTPWSSSLRRRAYAYLPCTILDHRIKNDKLQYKLRFTNESLDMHKMRKQWLWATRVISDRCMVQKIQKEVMSSLEHHDATTCEGREDKKLETNEMISVVIREAAAKVGVDEDIVESVIETMSWCLDSDDDETGDSSDGGDFDTEDCSDMEYLARRG